MPDDLPSRKRLHHDVPHWVEDGSLFFITVNCTERGREQLTLPQTACALLDAARFYHDQRKWHIALWLLMPDHFHAILSFPRNAVMADLFKHWKRYTAQKLGIDWQDGFFDHRLRNVQEENAKHHYIRHNPVRKNLCTCPEDWSHQLRWSSGGLVIGGQGFGPRTTALAGASALPMSVENNTPQHTTHHCDCSFFKPTLKPPHAVASVDGELIPIPSP